MSALPTTDITTMMVRNHIGDDVNAVYAMGVVPMYPYVNNAPYFNPYGFNNPNPVIQQRYWGMRNVAYVTKMLWCPASKVDAYKDPVNSQSIFIVEEGETIKSLSEFTFPEHHDLGAWRGYDKDWFCMALNRVSYNSGGSGLSYYLKFAGNVGKNNIVFPSDLTAIILNIRSEVSYLDVTADSVRFMAVALTKTVEIAVSEANHQTSLELGIPSFDVEGLLGYVPYFQSVETTISINANNHARRVALHNTTYFTIPVVDNQSTVDNTGVVLDIVYLQEAHFDIPGNYLRVIHRPSYDNTGIDPYIYVSAIDTLSDITSDGTGWMKIKGVKIVNEYMRYIPASNLELVITMRRDLATEYCTFTAPVFIKGLTQSLIDSSKYIPDDVEPYSLYPRRGPNEATLNPQMDIDLDITSMFTQLISPFTGGQKIDLQIYIRCTKMVNGTPAWQCNMDEYVTTTLPFYTWPNY